jgi:prevent-host-death family protein
VYRIGTLLLYLQKLNNTDMQVVTAREFRANQSKILTAARDGQSVMLTSRVGNFKIVPIDSEDVIIERHLKTALEEVKAHKEGRITLSNARDVVF